ncbi:hypothetical protein BGZ59_008363, partial [Podila verticillata]
MSQDGSTTLNPLETDLEARHTLLVPTACLPSLQSLSGHYLRPWEDLVSPSTSAAQSQHQHSEISEATNCLCLHRHNRK